MPSTRLVVAAALVAVVASACRSAPSGTLVEPTEEVSASAVPSVSGLGSGPSPSPTGTDASTSPEASESGAPPTDTDRARFAASYRPSGASDLEHVQVDVDGDGIDEIVFAYVRSAEGVGHVDVAGWNADKGSYQITAGADGGVADRIARVRIGDLNLDGVVEVALFQERGSSGGSVTLWSVTNDRLTPQVARDGCWNGLSTYGVIGAVLEDRDGDGASELYATCDDSPLPASAWSTNGYRWVDNAWRYDPSL